MIVDKIRLDIPSNPPPSAPLSVSNPSATPTASDGSSANAPSHSEVRLVKENGVFKVPVVINGSITLNFTVDSGAADVSIPADVVMVMIRTGTLSNDDFLGMQTYILADGSKVPSKTFRIKTLKIGERTVENVTGSMADVEGGLLLGQSCLSRFHSVSFDYSKQVLVLD